MALVLHVNPAIRYKNCLVVSDNSLPEAHPAKGAPFTHPFPFSPFFITIFVPNRIWTERLEGRTSHYLPLRFKVKAVKMLLNKYVRCCRSVPDNTMYYLYHTQQGTINIEDSVPAGQHSKTNKQTTERKKIKLVCARNARGSGLSGSFYCGSVVISFYIALLFTRF